ncbi:hypothetical protein HNY73_001605 [Argiope bruennichi]|uniref:C2H2-type domain-containing protein n=1 Tax=Argiope bruennichi TaxID=94029 RepID=A0A8T0G471_ARGBR|nr:hypothetical protein HNY73_001605 [Argiope bruennichi]
MSSPTKVSENLSFPATASLVSPPKTFALPSVVLSPRSPNCSNVGPPLPPSPDKTCLGNSPSSHDPVRPSRNSDPSNALNCPDPSQCDKFAVNDSSTSCSGLGTVATKPGSAVCERTRSKLAAKKQVEASASPQLKSQAVPPDSQEKLSCDPLKMPLGPLLATEECTDLKPDKDACPKGHPSDPQCQDVMPNFSLGSLGLNTLPSQSSPVLAKSPPSSLEDQLYLSPSPEKPDVREVVTLNDSPLANFPDDPSEWTKMFLGLLSGPPPAKAFASLPPVTKSICKYCELVLSSPVSLKLHLEEVHLIRSPSKSAAPVAPSRSNPALRLLPQFVCDKCKAAFHFKPSLLAHRCLETADASSKSPLGSDPPELASSSTKRTRPATSNSKQVVSNKGSLSYAAATSRKLPANPPPRPHSSVRAAWHFLACGLPTFCTSALCHRPVPLVRKLLLQRRSRSPPTQATPLHVSETLGGALGVSSSSTPPEPRPMLPCVDCNFLAKTRKGLRFHRYRQHSVPIAKRSTTRSQEHVPPPTTQDANLTSPPPSGVVNKIHPDRAGCSAAQITSSLPSNTQSVVQSPDLPNYQPFF